MKPLLCCILDGGILDGRAGKPPAPPGTYRVAAPNGLIAIALDTPPADETSPNTAELLAFAEVIRTFHASHDVIPLRYGCVMASKEAVVRLLEENGPHYAALLRTLHGMTEMGIRLLVPVAEPAASAAPLSPGAGYLASARARHGSGAAPSPRHVKAADAVSALLEGAFIAERREYSSTAGGALVSLYYLVPRSGAGQFMEKARAISLPEVKILLSGPWPPYNFADLS